MIKLFIYLHKICSSEAKYYLHLHKTAYHRNFKTRKCYREHHMHYATTRNKWHIVNCTKKKRKTLISILNKLFICLGIKAYKVPLSSHHPPPLQPERIP